MTNFDSHGVYYSAFNLLQDARHYDELGKRPEIRLYRAEGGRIEGIELLTPAPDDVPRCAKCGIWEDMPPLPYNDPNGSCFTFNPHPEPNGEHEWVTQTRPRHDFGSIGY